MNPQLEQFYGGFLNAHVTDDNARGIIEEYLADEWPELALLMLLIAVEAAGQSQSEPTPAPAPLPVTE